MFYLFSLQESANENTYICQKHTNVSCVAHVHSIAEIVFVTDGSITIITEAGKIELCKNQMYIFMPYEIHGYKTSEKSEIIVLGFSEEYIPEFKNCFNGKTLTKGIDISKDLQNHIAEFSKNIKSNSLLGQKAIIYKSLDEFWDKGEFRLSVKGSGDILRDTLLYISKNYHSNINLDTASKHLGITPVHLSRVINKMGFGFTDILNSIRIGNSRILLAETQKSITEIAYESGFGSVRNYNRVFKAYTGKTPKEFKNKISDTEFTISENMNYEN